MEENQHKSFTLSVDLMLTIVLVLSIMAVFAINGLSKKLSILQERIGFLEEHDMEMQKLKTDLFSDLLTERR